MPRELPSVRILPMSDKTEGFRALSIEDVQRRIFLGDLTKNGGRFRYQKSGLHADPGTIILFQFKARIIASATFLRDDKFETPRHGYGGALIIDPTSIRVFDPVDASMMRKSWPHFRGFGHVKQRLNPDGYIAFDRMLAHQRMR